MTAAALADATYIAVRTGCCHRCCGLLIWEPESWNIRRKWKLGAYRCVQCGEYIDLDVFRNRQTAQEPTPHAPFSDPARVWPDALCG
jgi:hypothetical protein